MEWTHGRDEVKLFFSPEGLVVVAPLPGGSYRIVATLADAPEHPGIADIQALLDARGPAVTAPRRSRTCSGVRDSGCIIASRMRIEAAVYSSSAMRRMCTARRAGRA